MWFEVFIIKPSASIGTSRTTACEALDLYRQWEADTGEPIGIRDAAGRNLTVEELEAFAVKESRK